MSILSNKLTKKQQEIGTSLINMMFLTNGRPSMNSTTFSSNTFTAPDDRAWQICILLLPAVSLSNISHILEPLQAANQISARPLYQWQLASAQGMPVITAEGLQLSTQKFDPESNFDCLLVIGDQHQPHSLSLSLLTALSKLNRQRNRFFGGIGSGAILLEKAGLLNNANWTVAPELAANSGATQPHALFQIAHQRFTCQGETANLDMMLHIIQQQHGKALTVHIAEMLAYPNLRQPTKLTRPTPIDLDASAPPALAEVLTLMQKNFAEPLSLEEISHYCGLGSRQIQRLFKQHIGTTPNNYYLQQRLDHAHRLLVETSVPIKQIASDSGFSSLPTFYKRYKSRFGNPPMSSRQQADIYL